jgi:hypothetical protein
MGVGISRTMNAAQRHDQDRRVISHKEAQETQEKTKTKIVLNSSLLPSFVSSVLLCG